MLTSVDVNTVSVLVAAIAAYAVGALWHGPLFGKVWMKLMNFTPASMKKMTLTPARAMTLGFFVTLFVSFATANFVKLLGAGTAFEGALVGCAIWLGFEAPILLAGYLWEGKSFNLWLFNATYRLVEMLVMASILAAW